MMKTQATPERIENIIQDAQHIIALANCMKLLHSMDMVDTKFKVPQINQKASRILSDAKDIVSYCFTIVKAKETPEYIEVEHAYEVLRTLRFFTNMHTEQLKAYNDVLETVPTIDVKDTINQM